MVDRGQGPLAGVRVIELDAPGVVPFVGMLLADLGADVIRVRRAGPDGSAVAPVLYRGRSEIALDLTDRASHAPLMALAAQADGVLEGFKAGVAEQLGLDPSRFLAANPRLVYARASGWGSDGPLSQRPGNDINFLAITGALHAIGTPEQPLPPLNLLSEFAGGGLFLALGFVSAVLAAQATGHGQVVEAAQVDGTATLMTLCYALHGAGRWADARASNLVDGGAPFYRCYACADGGHVAVGALEPVFFDALCRGVGIEPGGFQQYDRACWPTMAEAFAQAFLDRSRDEWAAHFEGVDACVTPVLSLAEAPLHPHNRARDTFAVLDQGMQPMPAPRFSGTPAASSPAETATIDEVLERWT